MSESNIHTGISSDRLHPEANNPREVAFSQEWQKLNNSEFQNPLLSHLLGDNFSKRDAMVAATVIQWLGSNVGMSFLADVMNREPQVYDGMAPSYGFREL